MRGAQLDRYRSNPVVLDSHNMRSALDVIGRATVKREGAQLVADVEFDEDEAAERIWQKVQRGFLRAVSIGYTVDSESVRFIGEGETDTRGGDAIAGPATIVDRWELHEISVVPVPADRDALKRDLYAALAAERTETMADDTTVAAPEAATDTEQTRAVCPEIEQALRDAELSKARRAERDARHAEIRAICPADLVPHLDGLLLEDPGMTFESARRALIDARKAASVHVGTPDPTEEIKTTTTAQGTEFDADTLYRSLCGY